MVAKSLAAAFDQLHRSVVLDVVLADFVNGDEVRVLEDGGRQGLRAEALHVPLADELPSVNHLQYYDAVERHLACLEDDAMPPRGDLFQLLLASVKPVNRCRMSERT
jgi:hypothetical protein